MKNINKIALLLSFLLLVIAFSLLSMSAMPRDLRYTWTALNPWNGIEGLAFSVGYFLHTNVFLTYLLTAGLIFLIWWRLYAIFNRIWN